MEKRILFNIILDVENFRALSRRIFLWWHRVSLLGDTSVTQFGETLGNMNICSVHQCPKNCHCFVHQNVSPVAVAGNAYFHASFYNRSNKAHNQTTNSSDISLVDTYRIQILLFLIHICIRNFTKFCQYSQISPLLQLSKCVAGNCRV